MPQQTYEVTAPDGRTLELTGDHVPTESELKQVFAALPQKETASADQTQAEPEAHSWLQKQLEGALGLPPSSLDTVKHAVSAIVDQAKKHPAAAGAMVAGAATAPLTAGMSLAPAAGFAGLMAGGGAAAGLLAHDAANAGTPGNIPTPADSAQQIGTQAALGAGGEVAGRGIQAAAKAITPRVASWLYDLGLMPSKTLNRDFPTAAETGLTEKILPTPDAIQARLSQVESNIKAAVKAADDARPNVRGLLGPAQPTVRSTTVDIPLGDAPTSEFLSSSKPGVIWREGTPQSVLTRTGDPQYLGTTAQPSVTNLPNGSGVLRRSTQEVVQPSLAPPKANAAPPTMVATQNLAAQAKAYVLQKANLLSQGGRGLREDAVKELNDLADQYLKENPLPMSLADTLGQKRAEQTLSTAAYKAESRGAPVNQIETLWHEGLAAANRKAVLTAVPSAAKDLATEQGLIGLKAMAEDRALKSSLNTFDATAILAGAIAGAAGGRPLEAAASAGAYTTLRLAMHSPTLTGAIGLATQKLGQIGQSQLTPVMVKALAAAYGADQGPQP